MYRFGLFEYVGDGGVFSSGYEKPNGEMILAAGGGGVKAGAMQFVTKKAETERNSKLT